MKMTLTKFRAVCGALGAIVAILASPACGQDETAAALEHSVMEHWVAIDNIYVPGVNIAWVSVAVQSEVFTQADAKELEKFARMRARNDLSLFTHVPASPDTLTARYDRSLPRIGTSPMRFGEAAAIVLSQHFRRQRFIEVIVMTVGTNYPVAWSVETEFSMHPKLASPFGPHSIKRATLGFGAEAGLKETVKAAMRDHIEQIASEVYEGVAEWEALLREGEQD